MRSHPLLPQAVRAADEVARLDTELQAAV